MNGTNILTAWPKRRRNKLLSSVSKQLTFHCLEQDDSKMGQESKTKLVYSAQLAFEGFKIIMISTSLLPRPSEDPIGRQQHGACPQLVLIVECSHGTSSAFLGQQSAALGYATRLHCLSIPEKKRPDTKHNTVLRIPHLSRL